MGNRPLVVAGNWKMHGDPAFVQRLITQVMEGLSQTERTDRADRLEVLVFPPCVYLQSISELIKENGMQARLSLGAQDADWHESGAYTGEIAPQMVRDAGCRYILSGHSERRTLFGESNDVVAKKFAAAQNADLIPVLCVGETLEARQADKTREVINAQVQAVLDMSKGVEGFRKALIAYEPVWAIGTGESATPEQAEEIHLYLRELIAEKDNEIAAQLSIIYGGSVNAANAAELFAMDNIDGALIGGASLKAPEFIKICRMAG